MSFDLPEHLQERTRFFHRGEVLPAGDFVLYWMATAVRADENPALDVARHVARQADLPLLVYQGLSEHYRYASDRHHAFMLQGASDVQQQFKAQTISYAFHLATPADRVPHLINLAQQAALVVAEDMPVGPPRIFRQRLAEQVDTPIWLVDTACVVPMQLVGEAHTRAFQFRNATNQLFAARVQRDWPQLDFTNQPYDLSQLPFTPVDLQQASIPDLISSCEIDHAVGPVPDTPGGSSAGYARWNEFKQHRLSRYAKTRNNPLDTGASRMSAYLHYGMVSPFRIARETSLIDNAGAGKYLDELFVWRELAYGFCFYRDDYEQWSALPDWAQATLQAHANDARQALYTWEQLARAQTDDALWNAAQRSLLQQGELHNNVRMTWGKAILDWTESPHRALETIIDLNHRYALDGRDPASYGGILWCLGQFDRPFKPPQPVIGTVRPRPTRDHAKRLNVKEYGELVSHPRYSSTPNIAVIGAGLSGLTAARTLADHGLSVTVFEKSRGVGGRMATRRTDQGDFDHGAQYFTVRDPRFRRYVDSWLRTGLVQPWPDTDEGQTIVVLNNGQLERESNSIERFVPRPTMNAIAKHLAQELTVQLNTRIKNIDTESGAISLFDDSGNPLGQFDRLIVSAPAAQTAELLSASFPKLANEMSQIEMNPCWATMASFDRPVTENWQGAFLHDSFLSWTSRNSTKPDRHPSSENVVIHASPEWTLQQWDSDPQQVAQMMLAEFWKVTGCRPQEPNHLIAHRWKYAIPVESTSTINCCDANGLVTVCGDWVHGGRVEGAFLTGMAAAGQLLSRIALVK